MSAAISARTSHRSQRRRGFRTTGVPPPDGGAVGGRTDVSTTRQAYAGYRVPSSGTTLYVLVGEPRIERVAARQNQFGSSSSSVHARTPSMKRLSDLAFGHDDPRSWNRGPCCVEIGCLNEDVPVLAPDLALSASDRALKHEQSLVRHFPKPRSVRVASPVHGILLASGLRVRFSLSRGTGRTFRSVCA